MGARTPEAPHRVGGAPLRPSSARPQLCEAEPHPVLSAGLGHHRGRNVESAPMHCFSFLGELVHLRCVCAACGIFWS